MNWQAVSFDWNQVRAFLATVEEGSLSAAAKALSTTQPTVGRQITALEEDLKVTLFERGGRSLVLTAAGSDLLEHVQAMADAASRVSMAAAGQALEVAGKVSITASDVIAATFLPAVLRDVRQAAPGIHIDVVASNRLEDLTRRNADIAIRHVRPVQPDLIAQQLPDFTAGFYASRRYVAVRGNPANTTELSGHSFIGPRDTAQMVALLEARGIRLDADAFKVTTDSGMVMWEMMRADLGIAVLPGQFWPKVDDALPVLEELGPIDFPVWLVTHRELKTSRRIRVVFDALAKACREIASVSKGSPDR